MVLPEFFSLYKEDPADGHRDHRAHQSARKIFHLRKTDKEAGEGVIQLAAFLEGFGQEKKGRYGPKSQQHVLERRKAVEKEPPADGKKKGRNQRGPASEEKPVP